MTTFNDREKSFEKKFEKDQELQFKVNARRNKLLGLWAAGLMGKSASFSKSQLARGTRKLRELLKIEQELSHA